MENVKKVHPILKAEHLGIKFGDFEANKNINLKVYAGQIHSIVGENGAGKSTLMKMLYGVYKPTSGSIRIDDKEIPMTPHVAIRNGIGMVFQDFRLIPSFTAADNILLALPKERQKALKGRIKKEIVDVGNKYKIPVDPDMLVGNMDLGQRQRVEIIKVMMMGDMRILIFDEPTSVLSDEEAQEFIKMIESLRNSGYAVLLITHKLDEVLACSDVISVLRRGEFVAKQKRSEGFDKEKLISCMMGEDLHVHSNYDDLKSLAVGRNTEKLSCKALNISNTYRLPILQNVNLEVNAGEIVGLAGISGKGQRELLDVIFGISHASSGQIFMEGEDITNESIKGRLNRGISLVSEDPKRDNVIPGMKIYEHFAMESVDVSYKKIGIDWDELKGKLDLSKDVKNLGVPDKNRIMSTLSGGNIQRCMLARASMKQPKLLLASYPSRGLDIGIVEEVHKILVKLRNEGCAILLVSEDLDELFAISDSIVVITGNTLSKKLDPKKITVSEIGELMVAGTYSKNDDDETVPYMSGVISKKLAL